MLESLQGNLESWTIQYLIQYVLFYLDNVMSKSLPEYEEKCLLNNLEKNRDQLILLQNEKHMEEMERLKEINNINPLEQFLEMIMYEIREVKAFMDAVEGRR